METLEQKIETERKLNSVVNLTRFRGNWISGNKADGVNFFVDELNKLPLPEHVEFLLNHENVIVPLIPIFLHEGRYYSVKQYGVGKIFKKIYKGKKIAIYRPVCDDCTAFYAAIVK